MIRCRSNHPSRVQLTAACSRQGKPETLGLEETPRKRTSSRRGGDRLRVRRMSPESFAALLLESRTSLVVLATYKALLLAVKVAHGANMAASDADITGEAAA